MLINFSNHPYKDWSEPQKKAASRYGECVDMPFPTVPPEFDETQIDHLAYAYALQIADMGKDITVHIMGEQTLCFALINQLLRRGIPCIASCTERDVVILPDGSKQVRFHFARFRHYLLS